MSLQRAIRRALRRAAVRPATQWLVRTAPLPLWLKQRIPVVGTFEVVTPDGSTFTYSAQAQDVWGREFRWFGLSRWERATVAFLSEQFKSSSVFWDIGAYAGIYSLLACAVNPEISVVAFEPVPAHVGMLRANAEANSWNDRVRIVQAAVTDRPSPVPLRIVADDNTSSGIGVDRPGRMIEVAAVRLSEISPPPDVIKIDVEGAEVAALSTAVEMIAARRPVIVAECLDRQALADLLGFVTPLGYSLAALGTHGATPVSEPFDIQEPSANFAAVPR